MAGVDIDVGGTLHATRALADFRLASSAPNLWPAAADEIAASNAYIPVSQCAQTLRQGKRPISRSDAIGQESKQNTVDYGVVLWRDKTIVEINSKPVYMVLPVMLIDRSGKLNKLHVKGYFMDGFVLLADIHWWGSALAKPFQTPLGLACIFGMQVNPAKTWLVPYTQLSGFHVLSKSRVITLQLPNGFGLCFEIDVDVPHTLIRLSRFRTRLDQRIELLGRIISGAVQDTDPSADSLAADGSLAAADSDAAAGSLAATDFLAADGWVVGTEKALNKYRRGSIMRLFKVLGIAFGGWLFVILVLAFILDLLEDPPTVVGSGTAVVATAVAVVAAPVRIITNALRPRRGIGVKARSLASAARVREIGAEHSDRPVTVVAWPDGLRAIARCQVGRVHGALSGAIGWLAEPESALLEVDGNRIRIIADDGRTPTARVLVSDGVAFIRPRRGNSRSTTNAPVERL